MSSLVRPRSTTLAAALAATVVLAGPTVAAQARLWSVGVFGDSCFARTGPSELRVHVENATTRPIEGIVTLDHPHPALDRVRTVRSAAVRIVANGSTEVRLVSAGPIPASPLELRLLDPQGRVLAQHTIRIADGPSQVIVDATPGSRYATAQRAQDIANDPSAGGGGGAFGLQVELQALESPRGPNSPLRVCPVERDTATGEVALPRSALSWGHVALVLVDATTLTSLARAERVALADYVHTGGQLGVTVERPAELRHPVLEAFVGSGVERQAGPLAGPQVFNFDETLGDSMPRPATFAGTLGFRGGNLHDRALASLLPSGPTSSVGATADYGDGQVHLLAWNTCRAPALDDPWSNNAVQRIARRERIPRPRPLFRVEADTLPVPTAVRDWLSPSVPERPGFLRAVWFCALAALALGPLFQCVARRGKGIPWRVITLCPLFAIATAIALSAAGDRHRESLGRARSISVADVPAGFARASVRRWRSYWTPTRSGFEVARTLDGSTLVIDPHAGTGRVSLLARSDATALVGIVSAPWIPLVVREDGFINLPGQVSIVPTDDGGIRVVNHLSVALEDVVVLAPDRRSGWWFRALGPGQGTLATRGRPLPAGVVARFASAGGARLPLWGTSEAERLAQVSRSRSDDGAAALAGWSATSPDRRAEWAAVIASASAPGRDDAWRLSGEPWVLARVAVETSTTDAGLHVDRDHTWIRVRGWGGAP